MKKNSMQKFNLIITVLALVLFPQNVSASALVGPSCFVTAEIIEIDHNNKYLNLKILHVEKNTDPCPVQENQVYRATDNYFAADNYPASFKEGDRIKAGIEAASSMGPSGAVSFLQWSDVTYENGSTIQYKKGIVTDLQSASEPIAINNVTAKEEGEEAPVMYFYIAVTALMVIGFLFYLVFRKRSAL